MNLDANKENDTEVEYKSSEDVVLVEGRGSVQVGQLKVDAAEQAGATSGLQGSGSVQVQQQQTPGTGACWERFLHVRSIRVLLVENDDSTRHVVTALLRNCNYEVLDAANGLQAWKMLEDLSYHIDIVLTEVVMPCLSGLGLLYKIMSHRTRKNIPVIMMSSHDSMGLVFKCLSKGAVDFLVKPIRKNELKNLWQHVWRRCHSSSGSESGTQTQKSLRSKDSEKSENNASDDGEKEASNGLNNGDGSDDGSGAQSSWTKQAVEVDSSQALSPMDHVIDCPDSTCAQVIHSNAEHSDNRKVQNSTAGDGEGQKQIDNIGKSNDLETDVHRNVEHKHDSQIELQPNPIGREPESREVVNNLDTNNSTGESKEPNLELSLKRLRGVQDTGRSVQDDRHVLRRSEQSAFSRYNTPTNIFKPPNGITGSSSVLDNSVEVAKRESVGDIQVYSADQIVYHGSKGVSNNIDMGSSTNKLPKDKSEATSAINGVYPSAFRHLKNDVRYSQQQVSLLHNGAQSTDICRGSYQERQVQHPHHHHHHYRMENQPSPDHDESSLMKMAVDAPHCGSTNDLGMPKDGTQRNYSLNRSASGSNGQNGSNHGSNGQNGSNHGSNVQNGSSTAVNAIGNNAESDIGQAGKSGSGDGSGSGSGSGSGNKVDENKLAQREAALIKFRLKRKDRCFQKKVRYQNRKKLAEQRPRVRGKFVKQSETDSSSRTGDE